MKSWKGKCVVIGVTGGIAAYKAAEIASRLRKLEAEVVCVMTKNATEFITPLTLESISGQPVVTDLFVRPATWDVEHISLAKRADLFLIAPATANIIAKVAHGIADDFLSTTVLATRAPILVAPAMNTGMYENVATQDNIQLLKTRGVHFVGPGVGYLACGDTGAGRLIDTDSIIDGIGRILFPIPQDMAGMKVLVTAGGSQEKLDPVRFITNRSSGRMGYAIAKAAQERGAQVTLVSGMTTLDAPKDVAVIPFGSTQNLLEVMMEQATHHDLIIQAAAPADYAPKEMLDQKRKKTGDGNWMLELVQTPDVAASIGSIKAKGQVFIGFAAETGDLIANAQSKLERKNCDMIVANDVTKPGAGFDGSTNIASLVTKDGVEDLPQMEKSELAGIILDRALKLTAERA